jgi:hypothetical protein
MASTLREPSSASRAGLEDDDYELQAALQASLMNQDEPIVLPHFAAGTLLPS